MFVIRNFVLDKQRVGNILLCIIVAAIPFKINVGNSALIMAVSFNLFFFNKENLLKLKSLSAIFPICFFLISTISGLLSKDFLKGIGQIDRQLLLLIIIIILINSDLSKKRFNNVLTTFFNVSVFATIVLLLNAFIKFLLGASIDEMTFHGFTALYKQHPVYYSLYLSFSVFYGFTKGEIVSGNNSILYFLSMLTLVLGLLLSVSKAVLFIDFIFFIILLFYREQKLNRRIIYAFFVVVFTIGVFRVNFIKERFFSGLTLHSNIVQFQPTNNFHDKKRFTYDEKLGISDLELRYIFLKIASYHLVMDNKLYFGYGQGDAQNYLDYYYFSYNLGPNWYEGFNIHNQYLHILIYYGIFILLFFLAYLIYSFKIAIHNKDTLYLFFLLSTCFVFIFEVPLLRNKGIVFFYFFNTLFLLKHTYFENSNFRH